METLGLVAKMTGALAIILGVMFFLVLLLRRFGLVSQVARKGMIEVVENRAILPKRYISLVKVAGNYYLIGSTEQGITLLGSIEPEGLKNFHQVLSERVDMDSGQGVGHE